MKCICPVYETCHCEARPTGEELHRQMDKLEDFLMSRASFRHHMKNDEPLLETVIKLLSTYAQYKQKADHAMSQMRNTGNALIVKEKNEQKIAHWEKAVGLIPDYYLANDLYTP